MGISNLSLFQLLCRQACPLVPETQMNCLPHSADQQHKRQKRLQMPDAEGGGVLGFIPEWSLAGILYYIYFQGTLPLRVALIILQSIADDI